MRDTTGSPAACEIMASWPTTPHARDAASPRSSSSAHATARTGASDSSTSSKSTSSSSPAPAGGASRSRAVERSTSSRRDTAASHRSPLRVLSLFSGIGAMDLGLELAGMEIAAQAEIEPHACRVLAERFPGVPNLGDVTSVEWEETRSGFIAHDHTGHHSYWLDDIDVIAGGFPCQDNSSARTRNERKGLDGDKSGLWREFARAVDYISPTWIIVENAPEWRRWVPRVRAELAGFGYATVPLLLSAGSFGAPHKRPRAVVVAHANGQGEPLVAIHAEVARLRPHARGAGYWRQPRPGDIRVADGAPDRMDRLRACGNAVVPQVFEWLGRQIIALDRMEAAT